MKIHKYQFLNVTLIRRPQGSQKALTLNIQKNTNHENNSI